MRTGRWALTALGLFTAGFAAMWILDGAQPAGANLSDPQLWMGAVIIGSAGLSLLAWIRSETPGQVLRGGGLGALAFVLVLAGFYGVLNAGMDDPHTVHVHEANGTARADLDPARTYREAPRLAEALDELVETNAPEVLVTEDTEVFERIQSYLVQETGDYVDPFSWRGTVVKLSVIV